MASNFMQLSGYVLRHIVCEGVVGEVLKYFGIFTTEAAACIYYVLALISLCKLTNVGTV